MNIDNLPKKSLSVSLLDKTLDPLKIFDVDNLYSESTKYNQILQNREFFFQKGVICTIVKMTPLEYLNKCSKGFNTTIKKNIDILKDEKISDYIESMRSYSQKFPVPILVYNHIRNTFLQEGRHRAMTAFYLDLPYIPVCVINIGTQEALNIIDHGWFESDKLKH